MSLVLRRPLAFNVDRQRISLPRTAYAWRVQFVPAGSLTSKRGHAPKLVNRDDGTPLFLDLDEGVDDLICEVERAGLYRLDVVGPSLRTLPGLEIGYIELEPSLFYESEAHAFAAVAGMFVGQLLARPPEPPLLPRRQEGSRVVVIGGGRAG